MFEKSQNEKGAVTLVEAVFVFPTVFIVVFILMMIGNVYYQRSAMQRGIVKTALNMAASTENPMLDTIIADGSISTDTKKYELAPYRNILGGFHAKSIEQSVGEHMEDYANSLSALAVFKGIKPVNVSTSGTKLSVYLIFSELKVCCSYDIQLPIRMLFSNDPIKFSFYDEIIEPVGDPAEFVRNAAMVKDYLEHKEQFMSAASKIGNYMNNITSYIK